MNTTPSFEEQWENEQFEYKELSKQTLETTSQWLYKLLDIDQEEASAMKICERLSSLHYMHIAENKMEPLLQHIVRWYVSLEEHISALRFLHQEQSKDFQKLYLAYMKFPKHIEYCVRVSKENNMRNRMQLYPKFLALYTIQSEYNGWDQYFKEFVEEQ